MRFYPRDEPLHRAIRLQWWHLVGVSEGEPGTVIDGVTYRGGVWNGPLTIDEVAAITAAGYGSRLVIATDLGQLPSTID